MENQPVPPSSSSPPTFVWVAVLMGVAVLAVQLILLFVLLDTRTNVEGVADDLRSLELRVAGGEIPGGGAPVAAPTTVATTPATAPPGTSQPPATDTPATTVPNPIEELPSSPAPEFGTDATGLPAFTSNTTEDPAVGAQLGDLGAVEWEAGQEVVIDLADGTARAIVVWAPWCEPCLEQLPELEAWQTGPGADLEDVELVTVASAAAENPEVSLAQYLDEQAFAFPVFLDSDDELAARLGVTAFPFWVFVSPEGQVIGRIAGQLPPDQFTSLFDDLAQVAAGG